jgi:hypothetical protein
MAPFNPDRKRKLFLSCTVFQRHVPEVQSTTPSHLNLMGRQRPWPAQKNSWNQFYKNGFARNLQNKIIYKFTTLGSYNL